MPSINFTVQKKKTKSLEEKIAKAQEKVRQRAEQRRQQYDKDLLRQQSGIAPEIKAASINKDEKPPILPQEPTPVHDLKKPTQLEHDLGNITETELSHELSTPSENPQYKEIEKMALKDDGDLKNDEKSELIDKMYEPKNNITLAESSSQMSDSTVTQGSTLCELPKIDIATTVQPLHDCAPIVDVQILHDGKQSVQEDQELVVEANVVQEFDAMSNSSLAPLQNVSSPIYSIKTNQDSGLLDTPEKIATVLSESEKVDDGQTSVTQSEKLISNDIAETESENDNNPLNKTDTQSNDTESIQPFIESDPTNRSNIIDNVELTSNNDGTVNTNEENPQETNTFDISFQEPPTVELQDPQINPDMLESLQESNTDSDISTLMTQESTNDELQQHNAFELGTANAELPEDNSETDGVIPASETHPKNIQLQNHIHSIDLVESNNKENADIENRGHKPRSTKISETQIHNPDSNMDLETAAVTIQKVFRTFLFKSRASTFDETINGESIYLNEDEKNKVIISN